MTSSKIISHELNSTDGQLEKENNQSISES